jgi:hypothetical protein
MPVQVRCSCKVETGGAASGRLAGHGEGILCCAHACMATILYDVKPPLCCSSW